MKTTTQQSKRAGQGTLAFTLIELLMVISIIGIVAGMVVVGIRAASGKRDEAAVKAKLAKLVLAIESYKARHGFYPPDDPTSAKNTPQYNSLAYELSGVRVSAPNLLPEADPTHTLTPAMLASYFNLLGLANAGKNMATPPKYSLNLVGGSGKTADYVLATNGAPGIPAAMFLQVPAEHPDQTVTVNLWRYQVYPANGHNPKSYDLWAELRKGKKVGNSYETNTIGNWK